MKKIIYILIASAAMFSMAVSCAKEEQLIEDTAEQTVDVTTPAVPATISVSIPEEGLTKVGLEQDSDPDGVVKLTWDDSDFITVKNASDESKSVDFTYLSGAGSATATFSAPDISALDGASRYNVYLSSNLPADYSNQTQASDGSTAHLGYSAKLAGVNTYDGATFSQTWATANGSGTLTSSSVLRIRAQLPTADIADAVQAVIIKADKDIFNGKDSIRVEMTPGVAGDSKIVTVYATLPPGDVSEATTTKLLFQFQKSANGNDRLTAYRELATLSLNSGSVNAFKINCPNIASYANPSTTNIGQSTNPYLIGDQNQLQWLSTNMTTGTTYFTLVDDINMNGGTFTSFNNADPYDKAVVLDGNDKTVSNLTTSLFADLNGTVSDLTLYNAVVSSAESVGILANTCNTAASTVTGVTINGTSTLTCTATAERVYVGGLVGEVSTASSFNDCHITDLKVTSPTSDYTYSGAAFGYVHNVSVSIGATSKCTLESCTLTAGNWAAGFISYLNGGTVSNNEVECTVNGGSTISAFVARIEAGSLTNNTVTGSVSGKQTIGGLVGNLSGGTLSGNTTSVTITATNYYCGGIVGMMRGGSVENCHASGKVTANNVKYVHSGGLIGRIEGSITVSVAKCSASGDVEAKGAYAGGLVGIIAAGPTVTIEKCYATGNVTTASGTYNKWVGGLIGMIDGSSTSVSVSVNDCYSTGTVTGSSLCGGFVGYIKSATLGVTRGYTSSSISATTSGPLLGQSAGTTTCTSFVAWSSAEALVGSGTAVADTGNYLGTEDTILEQAQAFTDPNDWDFTTVWNEVNPPTLR